MGDPELSLQTHLVGPLLDTAPICDSPGRSHCGPLAPVRLSGSLLSSSSYSLLLLAQQAEGLFCLPGPTGHTPRLPRTTTSASHCQNPAGGQGLLWQHPDPTPRTSLPPSISPPLSPPSPAFPGRTRGALARVPGPLPFRRVARRCRWPWRSTTSRRSRWFHLPRYGRAPPFLPRSLPSVPSAPGRLSRSSRSAAVKAPRCPPAPSAVPAWLSPLPLPREPWTRPGLLLLRPAARTMCSAGGVLSEEPEAALLPAQVSRSPPQKSLLFPNLRHTETHRSVLRQNKVPCRSEERVLDEAR